MAIDIELQGIMPIVRVWKVTDRIQAVLERILIFDLLDSLPVINKEGPVRFAPKDSINLSRQLQLLDIH